MANKDLFKSSAGVLTKRADTVNEAGGVAYAFSAEHALAQYAITGCMNATYYVGAEEQLGTVLELCENIAPEFIAKVAVYCREKGYMKDMPALLCAVLSSKDPALLEKIFDRVLDNGKMLRNFVQIVRSGVTGRKSFGTRIRRLIRQWLDKRDDDQIFRSSVGNDPSLADVIKMVHPKPQTASREALYGRLIGKEHNAEALPDLVKQYEAFKAGDREQIPNVPFQLLDSLDLGTEEWTAIARNASWQMTRMNLNTFARHSVFDQPEMTEMIASRLRNKEQIARARVFPYQLMVAYNSTSEDVPEDVRNALQDAMEIAIENVPTISGKIHVFPDVSGSMHSPVTGYRPGATSAVRCVDVAALVAAALIRKNPNAEVLPFGTDVCPTRLNPRDSVMTNAQKLASINGGGTNCSAPLRKLNEEKAEGDLIVYVSDNESWIDTTDNNRYWHDGTETLKQWNEFKQRNPKARMVCIDIQPCGTTQADDREDILNVGGFSDQVFDVIAQFSSNETDGEHFVGIINEVTL